MFALSACHGPAYSLKDRPAGADAPSARIQVTVVGTYVGSTDLT